MTNLDTSLIALVDENMPEIVRTQNQSATIVNSIPIVLGGGKNCAWVVDSDGYGASVQTYSEGADFTSYRANAQLNPKLDWGRYHDEKFVTGTALRSAQNARASRANDRLWLDQVKAAVRKVTSDVGIEIVSGTGSDHVIGLETAVSDDNTYAGINRHTTTNRPFRSKVIDPGTPTAITFPLIRADLSAIEKEGGVKPNEAWCSFEVFDKVAALFDNFRQVVQQVSGARGSQELVYGADFVMVDGCIFRRDKNITANRIYYCNTDCWRIEVNAPEGDVGHDAMDIYMADDGVSMKALPLMFMGLPKTGDAHKFACFTEIAFVVTHPNRFGVRLNVVA